MARNSYNNVVTHVTEINTINIKYQVARHWLSETAEIIYELVFVTAHGQTFDHLLQIVDCLRKLHFLWTKCADLMFD